METTSKKDHLPSFSHHLDAIVLAGTPRDPKRTILGKNKAFLDIDGRPLLQHVLDALMGTKSIADIFVVGPVEQMSKVLTNLSDEIHLIQQEGNILANGWAGVHASESLHAEDGNDAAAMRPILVITCDLPVISSFSVDDFVARCADEDQASDKPCGLMVGVADEAGLAPFCPDGDKPGIVRPFVQLDFARIRLANIHVARPRLLTHQEILRTGFSYRKAINWKNVVGLAFSFLSQEGGLRSAWLTLRLQATALAARRGGRLYRFLRRGNTRNRVEACTSKVLGCPLRLIITPFGGLSLDVDDAGDLRVLDQRYHDWMAIHKAVRSEYPLGQIAEDPAS